MPAKKPIEAAELERLARQKSTVSEICQALGITDATLYNRMHSDRNLREAFDRGRELYYASETEQRMDAIEEEEDSKRRDEELEAEEMRASESLDNSEPIDAEPLDAVVSIDKLTTSIDNFHQKIQTAEIAQRHDEEMTFLERLEQERRDLDELIRLMKIRIASRTYVHRVD